MNGRKNVGILAGVTVAAIAAVVVFVTRDRPPLAEKDKAEATAVAAIVDALAKSGLTGGAFVDAINLSAPLADSSMKSDGRVVKWVAEATKITSDTTKLSAGVRSAFGIESATVAMIVQESNREEGAALAEEAADFAQIIQLVMMIIDLLTKLGIIGG